MLAGLLLSHSLASLPCRHSMGYLLGSVLRDRLQSSVGFHGLRPRLAYLLP